MPTAYLALYVFRLNVSHKANFAARLAVGHRALEGVGLNSVSAARRLSADIVSVSWLLSEDRLHLA
ncbi:hypothetical protein BDV95DRAFT_559643 [Massariosphaeria phaeospora]|uniref:Uncharacterized protein n=1 Tax=Massariosphaeria phaeospora TaxID=100035 RepID=A0A7C8IEG8_9PLEO|nr:hypothetical protein BDV95DRAFT_559643 [Massariosphaeria phaeospora]